MAIECDASRGKAYLMGGGSSTQELRVWRLALVVAGGLLPLVAWLDHWVFAAVQAVQWPWMAELMQAVTWLGYGAVDVGIFVALALFGWWTGDRGLWTGGLWAGGTVAVAGLASQVLKNLACRARPTGPGAGTFFAGFPCFPAPYAYASFPSGHATTAFAAAVLLALWFPRQAGVFLGTAGLVALSRIVLGSHFPSDAVGGALLGSSLALAAYAYLPALREARMRGPSGSP